jgi:hypothetical protein
LKPDYIIGLFDSKAPGISTKSMTNTAPTSHNLKQLLKMMALDLLLNLVEKKARAKLEVEIILSGKPGNEATVKANARNLVANYWYTYNSLGIFLNNTEKWDVLPTKGQCLARLLEVIAHQHVTSQVSHFHIATFAVAIFLYDSVGSFLTPYKFPATAKWSKDAFAHDLLINPSLWSHSMKHAVQEVEVPFPWPFSLVDEGRIDQWLGKLKVFSSRSSNKKSDLENMFRLLLESQDNYIEQTGDGEYKEGRSRYEGGFVRNQLLFFPCFAREFPDIVLLALLERCANQTYSSAVGKLACGSFFVCKPGFFESNNTSLQLDQRGRCQVLLKDNLRLFVDTSDTDVWVNLCLCDDHGACLT